MLPKMPIGAMGCVMTKPMMMSCQRLSERRRRCSAGASPMALMQYRPASFRCAHPQRCTLVQTVFVDLFRKHRQASGAEDAGVGTKHGAGNTGLRTFASCVGVLDGGAVDERPLFDFLEDVGRESIPAAGAPTSYDVDREIQ